MAYDLVYRNLVFPAWHALKRDGALRAIRESRRNAALNRSGMEAVERRKLALLLEHAARHVPYWTELLEGLGASPAELLTPGGFERLPILTKAIVAARNADLVSTELTGNRLDPNTTSGSTGEPMRFYTDVRSKMHRKAAEIRNRGWIGVRQGERAASLWGSAIDQARAETARGRLHGLVARECFLSAYRLSDEDMARHAETLQRFRPRLLIGYPSVLREFARFCELRGETLPSLRAIVCSAEAMYEHHREEIGEAFRVPVYNRYGCREAGCIAQEHGADVPGLVVNSDRVKLEIVGPDGRAVPRGETGDILVTDLDNYGMPLIRYRIGDRAAWHPEQDPSFAFPSLAGVEGRSLDVVCTPGGRRVGGTFWTILFRSRSGMAQVQVVQPALDRVVVRYVPEHPGADIAEAYFRSKIAAQCGEDLCVAFEAVERIEPEPNGKFRLVKSEILR